MALWYNGSGKDFMSHSQKSATFTVASVTGVLSRQNLCVT